MSDKLYFIIEASCLVIIATILTIKYLCMKHTIKKLTEQNTFLRKDNIGLMQHNGKLYDENQKLRKAVAGMDIPDYTQNW